MGDQLQYPVGLYPAQLPSTAAVGITREEELDDLICQFPAIVCQNPNRTTWQLPIPLPNDTSVVQLHIHVPLEYPQTAASLRVLDPIDNYWVDRETGEVSAAGLVGVTDSKHISAMVHAAFTCLTGQDYNSLGRARRHSRGRSLSVNGRASESAYGAPFSPSALDRKHSYDHIGPSPYHANPLVQPAPTPLRFQPPVHLRPRPAGSAEPPGAAAHDGARPGEGGPGTDIAQLRGQIREKLGGMDADTLTELLSNKAAMQAEVSGWLVKTHAGVQHRQACDAVRGTAQKNRSLVQSISDTQQQVRVSQSGEMDPLTHRHDELLARQAAVCSKVDVDTLVQAARSEFEGMDRGDTDRMQILSSTDAGEGGALTPAMLSTRMDVFVQKRKEYWRASIRVSAADKLPR